MPKVRRSPPASGTLVLGVGILAAAGFLIWVLLG